MSDGIDTPTPPSWPDRHALIPAFPVLETRRLGLVELTLDDAEWYLAHFSRPEIVTGTGFPAPDSLDDARDELQRYVTGLFDRRDGIRWGLAPRDAPGTIAGTAGIYRWRDEPEPAAEVGYDLAPEWWGRGLMAEALEAIADYVFGHLGLAYLEATVLVGNDRSCRTLERAGFLNAGILPLHGEDEHGELRDEHRYVRRRR
jgi:[ribosomal protein S5]-alanine N-acetyltransferase